MPDVARCDGAITYIFQPKQIAVDRIKVKMAEPYAVGVNGIRPV
jgi:hypothetical protein